MRKVDKAKPSRNQMVVAFRSYLKAVGMPSAAWHKVVKSPDGLAWEDKYEVWYRGNGFRNMNKIYNEWTKPRWPGDYYFAKDARGLYYPTQGNGIRKPRIRKGRAAADTHQPITAAAAATTTAAPRAMNVNGVLIVPVTSVDNFQAMLDSLKGVLDVPDFLGKLIGKLNEHNRRRS